MQQHHSQAGAGSNPSLASEPTNDLQALVIMFFRNSWLISVCVVLALAAAAIYYKRAPKVYQASTTVQVEQEEKKVVKIEQVVQEDLRTSEILNTIVQKLKSQPLLERVLATNGIIDAATLLGKAPPPGAKPMSHEQLVQTLDRMVKTSLRRNTRLIDVMVSHTSPELAAKLANSIVEQYMGLDTEAKSTTTKGAYSFLKGESERLKKKLETSEAALQAYREQVGSMVMMQGDNNVALPQLQELNLKLAQAKAETIRLKVAADQVEKTQGNIDELLTVPLVVSELGAADSRTLWDGRAQVAKAESDFAVIQKRYKAKHPKYIQAATLLAESRAALSNTVLKAAASVKAAYENAAKTEQGLQQAFQNAQEKTIEISKQAIHYNLLAREVDSDRALFDSILNRLKETSLTTDMQSGKIQIVEPAVVPERPTSPKATLIFGMALLGGLMLGSVLAFAIGALDTSIKGVDEAEEYLRLPVLTAIPTLKDSRKGGKALVAAEGSRSQGAEAFRTLRASLTMLGREDERRTFLFTSALPQEGKSFNSLNFAVSLSQQGLRTLLIDADLRRPSIAKYLAADTDKPMPGLSDYLVGRNKLSEVVRTEQGVDNFYWMPAGRMAPNPAELLSGENFGALLDEALKEYDRVVVDSAPVHAVSDTLLIANKVQTTIMVLRGCKTPRKAVARCAQLLQKSGAKLSGCVLNLLPRRRGHGYGYYDSYYSYGYHGYYGNEEKKGSHRKASKKQTAAAEVEKG